ncbi:uncharacterized protein LOC107862140 [Capsicum annuum]|uniref:uncharacterized protein LOC107862140 n=1 Tax=Capsicum annuum TaxID=4072 RepID=UPI001FB072F0|nr:uncharacterized protein LOC107862140 [Capsicum annuum]
MRRFNSTWYEDSYSRWMEYSVKKDAVFRLCCYLFKNDYIKGNAGDFFTKTGFKTWNHSLKRFQLHVGEVNNVHRRCFSNMLDFENQSQSIQVALSKQSEKIRSVHRIHLEASTTVAKFLLKFGLSFRGHDERASFKRRDQLRDHQAEMLEQLLESGEIQSGKGLNQQQGLQRPELSNCFDVVSGNLLLGMASLNPANVLANFDKEKIMILVKYYLDEFGESKLRELNYQLDTFNIHMRRVDPIFSNLKGIGDLAEALVNANLVVTYSLVYLLVKLTLILPVATATVERAFP